MEPWTLETNLTVPAADRTANQAIVLNDVQAFFDKFNELYPYWYLMDEDDQPYLLDSATGKRTPSSPYISGQELMAKVTGLKLPVPAPQPDRPGPSFPTPLNPGRS